MGVDKIFGNGISQTGGFLIPQNKINQLIQYKDLLTKKQKEEIVSALHTGGKLIIKPTKRQTGGFLGTLLASIGIPMVLKALTGNGLQVDKSRSRRSANIHVPNLNNLSKPKDGGLVFPPPFFGSWDNPTGSGKPKKKAPKKKGKGLLLGPKSPFNQIPLIGAIF